MKCFIGLGSSLGDRRDNLEKAAHALRSYSSNSFFRLSPIYTTPALMPPGAPLDWNVPYLNAVAQIEWSGEPDCLLVQLKQIEKDLGRTKKAKWAPRVIDLDLLTYGRYAIENDSLTVPHKKMLNRSFVLDPMKDLESDFVIPRESDPVVVQARKLTTHSPLIMGIINLTPDSFSDGGEVDDFSVFESRVNKMAECGVPIIDLGAESTRPGARVIDADEEWQRLEHALQHLQSLHRGKFIRPLVSVDTCKSKVAERAIECGADWINDVSGASDPKMLSVLKQSQVDFVLTHSLTVPADPQAIMAWELDPVNELKVWLTRKLEDLSKNGIDLNRIIFDPGIGFGKNAFQSLSILKRIDEFSTFPIRLLVGHSRKSFMKLWNLNHNQERDAATLGLSLGLIPKGVDILRVHDFQLHITAFKSRAEVLS